VALEGKGEETKKGDVVRRQRRGSSGVNEVAWELGASGG